MRTSLMLLMLLLALPSSAAERLATVPERFRGKWAADPAHCTIHGETSLTITADRLAFYESHGPLLGIAGEGDDLALLMDASGEGQSWVDARLFRLVDAGDALMDVTGRRAGMTRCRCPEAVQ